MKELRSLSNDDLVDSLTNTLCTLQHFASYYPHSSHIPFEARGGPLAEIGYCAQRVIKAMEDDLRELAIILAQEFGDISIDHAGTVKVMTENAFSQLESSARSPRHSNGTIAQCLALSQAIALPLDHLQFLLNVADHSDQLEPFVSIATVLLDDASKRLKLIAAILEACLGQVEVGYAEKLRLLRAYRKSPSSPGTA